MLPKKLFRGSKSYQPCPLSKCPNIISVNEFSDKELLEKFLDPDTRSYAFNLLVRKYQEPVYLHIRRMVIDHDDTNDIVQNVFIKVWKNLETFREDSKLYTWIYRIATNESITFLKRKRNKYFLPLEDVANYMSSVIDSGNYYNGDEIQTKLQKAILNLPTKQRLIFNMKYFEELKYEEISEILGTSIGALKASYHHAVKKIEKQLKEN